MAKEMDVHSYSRPAIEGAPATVMVPVAPGSFVNQTLLKALGLVELKTDQVRRNAA